MGAPARGQLYLGKGGNEGLREAVKGAEVANRPEVVNKKGGRESVLGVPPQQRLRTTQEVLQ